MLPGLFSSSPLAATALRLSLERCDALGEFPQVRNNAIGNGPGLVAQLMPAGLLQPELGDVLGDVTIEGLLDRAELGPEHGDDDCDPGQIPGVKEHVDDVDVIQRVSSAAGPRPCSDRSRWRGSRTRVGLRAPRRCRRSPYASRSPDSR